MQDKPETTKSTGQEGPYGVLVDAAAICIIVLVLTMIFFGVMVWLGKSA